MRTISRLLLLIVAGCASPPPETPAPARATGETKVERVEKAFAAPEESLEAPPDLENGHALLIRHCGSCHAVDRSDASKHQKAEPFREISQKYPVEALGEALAEGLDAGHPDMPEYKFEPSAIRDTLAWIASIQSKP